MRVFGATLLLLLGACCALAKEVKKVDLYLEDDMKDVKEEMEVAMEEEQDAMDMEDEISGEKSESCQFCGAGRECVSGECMCVEACMPEKDNRRKVCSNHNETWASDCEMYRARCQCEDGLDSCSDQRYAHVHIDYYGVCQELPECPKEELDDFPRRMNEWLFAVMRDMADRQLISEHYTKLEREAEENPSKQWTNAVVWKWCELDSHPRDRSVSRHELFPIRAPLVALEHCIGTFLDSCDPDDDHVVTLKEWAHCTKLSESDLESLADLCESIREDE